MIGYGAIVIAFLAIGVSMFFYAASYKQEANKESEKNKMYGNRSYCCAGFFVLVATLYLLYIIFNDQFQYAYVVSYSSRELPGIYKLSALWAGQEGSFLLWLMFHVLLGLALIRSKAVRPGVMFIYSALQTILLVILLVKNPYMLLGTPQVDGMGLNPLLQNPWMVIHPPMIFLGYAGLAIPFSYGIEGLLTKRGTEWIVLALPWTLFAWATLGAGIFIGGFWAYKVLGWGGYWAWDPVENSSLLPWLLVGVLVHCLFLSKLRPAAVKFAHCASIISLISVLYGTFLTRSGILKDFSVHSFGDEGVGGLLAVLILALVFLCFLLLILRWPSLPQGELFTVVRSREFLLVTTGLILTAMASIIFLGMSTPLFTMFFVNPQSVSASFYNITFLPLATILSLLFVLMPLGIEKTEGKLFSRFWWLMVVAIVAGIGAYHFDLKQPLIILVIGLSSAAILSNIISGYRRMISQFAALTHIGVAVMVLGIVVSSAGDERVILSISKQETQEVFGDNITYLGLEKDNSDTGMYQNFIVERQGQQIKLRPYVRQDKYSNMSGGEPAIYQGLSADLYLAPTSNYGNYFSQEISLGKGEEISLDGLNIVFLKYGMENMENEVIRFQSFLEISKDGITEKIMPYLQYRNGMITSVTEKAFGQHEFRINSVNLEKSIAVIGYRNLMTDKEPIEVEFSRKPLISLVWLGAILISLSTALAMVKFLTK